jgi:hypothetical protein
MNNEKKELRSAPFHYQSLVDRIVKLAMIKHKLPVYETNDCKKWLTHHNNGVPVMAYNPKYIIGADSKCKWAVVALFASEVAYHYNMDFYGKYICEYYNLRVNRNQGRKRLGVDHFVGRVLRYEGASLEEALEVLSTLCNFKSDEIRYEREEKFVKGWKAADDELAILKPVVIKKKEEKKNNPNPGAPLAALVFGLLLYLFKG